MRNFKIGKITYSNVVYNNVYDDSKNKLSLYPEVVPKTVVEKFDFSEVKIEK